MALPILNDTPQYTMTIPSSGKEVKFRPYLIKEEKVLLIAAESQDMGQAISAIQDTIEACTHGVLDPTKLATFDLEYAYLKIRSKSVGERVELTLDCAACDKPVPFMFDMKEVKIDIPEMQWNVQITDTISVDLQWPRYADIDLNADASEVGFEMVAASIKAVCTEDERIMVADEPKEEVMQFLYNLTSDQFEKIVSVVSNIPKVYYEVEETCSACGTGLKQQIQGIKSFF